MTTTLRPHDLIWLTARDALEGITESWVEAAWHTGLPVVVRRDVENGCKCCTLYLVTHGTFQA